MPSGGYRRLTAFILWPFSPSKKSPLDPPSPWSWLGAYFDGTERSVQNSIYTAKNILTTALQESDLESFHWQNGGRGYAPPMRGNPTEASCRRGKLPG